MSGSFDIAAITKQRLKDELFGKLPGDGWYKLVVDEPALHVLSSHMEISELIDYNISVVDPLNIERSSAKRVAYFISPTVSSVNRMIRDFQQPQPLYEQAFVFFSSKAQEKVVGAIKSCSPLVDRLACLREIHVEFANVDDRALHTMQPRAMQACFGADIDAQQRQAELARAAVRLATVFTTLKSRPGKVIARSPASADLPDLPGREFRVDTCRELGKMVIDRLDKWAARDANLFTGPPCDLIILDRPSDSVAPVMHPFHYAAMAHDVANLIDGKVFRYSWTGANGEDKTSEHAVSTQDAMWAELRHMHIADVATTATARLKEFSQSRVAQVERVGMGADVGDAAQRLPEFMAKKAQLSMHVALSQAIFKQVSDRDLIELGRLEQGLVFGDSKSKDLLSQMQAWKARGSSGGAPTKEDRIRVLMAYFATHPGRLDAKNRENWMSVAQLTDDDMRLVSSAQYLGVELNKERRAGFGGLTKFTRRGAAKKALRIDRSNQTEAALENGRFQPLLLETVSSFVNNRLSVGPGREFDAIQGGAHMDGNGADNAAGAPGAKSVRTNARPAPTWHRRAASQGAGPSARADVVGARGRVVVVFVIGGCTWSEIQVAHELSQMHGIEVVLGSTHVFESGEQFLLQVAQMAPKHDYTPLDVA